MRASSFKKTLHFRPQIFMVSPMFLKLKRLCDSLIHFGFQLASPQRYGGFQVHFTDSQSVSCVGHADSVLRPSQMSNGSFVETHESLKQR